MKVRFGLEQICAVTAIVALWMAQTAQAQQVGAPGAVKPATAATANPHGSQQQPAAAPQKPGAEGIKVHGHWIIDVKNPDGTVVQHRDFENSLVNPSGNNILIGLLGGYYVPGSFIVLMGSGSGTSPCVIAGGSSACYIAQHLISALTFPPCDNPLTYCSNNLTYAASLDSTSGLFSLTLAGSVTAGQNGQIAGVNTTLVYCQGPTNNPYSVPTTAPTTSYGGSIASCQTFNAADASSNGSPFFGAFSGTTITPVPVSSGQIVQVSVTFSFS